MRNRDTAGQFLSIISRVEHELERAGNISSAPQADPVHGRHQIERVETALE
jgi:hypothetical protein